MFRSRQDIHNEYLRNSIREHELYIKGIYDRENFKNNLVNYVEIEKLQRTHKPIFTENIFKNDFVYLESKTFISEVIDDVNTVKIIHEKANFKGNLLVSNIKLIIETSDVSDTSNTTDTYNIIKFKFGSKQISEFLVYNDNIDMTITESLIKGLLCVPSSSKDNLLNFESLSKFKITCDFYLSKKNYISLNNRFIGYENTTVTDNLITLENIVFDVIIIPFVCKNIKLYFYNYRFPDPQRNYYTVKDNEIQYVNGNTFIKLNDVIDTINNKYNNDYNNKLVHIVIDDDLNKNFPITINSYKNITYQNGLYVVQESYKQPI